MTEGTTSNKGESTQSVTDSAEESSSEPVIYIQAWEDWTTSIHKRRINGQSSTARTIGFLQQLATEAAIYGILGCLFALLVWGLHMHTPFLLMFNFWYNFPIYVGAAVTFLFYECWDSWLRPSEEN